MNFIKKIMKKTVLYDLLSVKFGVKRNNRRKKTLIDVNKHMIEKYKDYYGRYPDLENPKKFSEILLWQKMFFYDENATIMTDKLLCKDFLQKIVGGDLQFAEVFASYTDADEINIDELPSEFVLKCNHNTGFVFHVKRSENGKFDIRNLKDKTHKKYSLKAVKKILNELLKVNFYYSFQEWNYKNIKPKVFAEEFLDTSDFEEYKVFVNDGELRFFYIVSNRQTDERNDFFDSNFQPMNVWADVPPSDVPAKLPYNIHKIIEIAKKLSVGFPILRVDLYNANNKIYFGEATFFHMGGYLVYKYPENLDDVLGQNVDISNFIEIALK